MSGRRLRTQEMYDQLVDAFREDPGNALRASKIVGIERRTAKRVYEDGWTDSDPSWIPIRKYLDREREEVRAQRQQIAEEQRKAAAEQRERTRQDAINTQTEEAKGVARARANAIGLSAVVGKLIMGCIPLADRLQKMIADPDEKMTIRDASHLITRISRVVSEGNAALEKAMQMERLRLGEPTAYLGVKAAEDMSTEDMVAHLASMYRTLERAKKLGGDIEQAQREIDSEDSQGGGSAPPTNGAPPAASTVH